MKYIVKLTAGAPERILENCSRYLTSNGTVGKFVIPSVLQSYMYVYLLVHT